MTNVSTNYQAGYEQARRVDQEAADTYVAHTLVGDPIMDLVVVELVPLPQEQVHELIEAGMDGDREG